MTRSAYVLERAWVGGAVVDDVRVEIEDGRFVTVEPAGQSSRSSAEALRQERELRRFSGEAPAVRLPGLTLPGLANCHSHAFHRALRGRTQRGSGTFWTWREQMYAVAGRLDPDSYYALARATYAEMLAGGITSVGEFHYLHHQPDGTPYDEPNAMGQALVGAARDVGLRIALLDTCYLSSGFGEPVEGAQRRYTDGDAEAWATRVGDLDVLATADARDGVRVGAAIHSVRAVPDDQLATVVAASAGRPLHVHLSEQVAENDACIAAYGATPTQLLADHGVLGPDTTAVHATHLTADDIAHLGTTRTHACFCPTTERDLGDGVGTEPRPPRRGEPGSRSAPTATRSSTSSRRCVRSSSTSGWRTAAAATGRPPSSSGPRPGPGTQASASPTPARSPSGRGPTWSRSRPAPRAPRAPGPTSTRPSSPRPPPTSATCRRRTRGRPRPRRGGSRPGRGDRQTPPMTSTLH